MDASIIKNDRSAQQSLNPLQLTLGVEEEFHLVDLETRHLTPRAGELLDGLSGCTGTFTAELQQSVVETNTDVARSLPALRHNLVQLRQYLDVTQQMDPIPELHLQPEPNARYELVDQVLAVTKQAKVTKMGFVGNEAYMTVF